MGSGKFIGLLLHQIKLRLWKKNGVIANLVHIDRHHTEILQRITYSYMYSILCMNVITKYFKEKIWNIKIPIPKLLLCKFFQKGKKFTFWTGM